MMKRSLISTLLLCAISLVLASSMDAQTTGAYTRLKFVEEFTSTTCGPCAGAAPILNAAISVEKGVISVRYHVPIPVAGDPWNAENPQDGEDRRAFYGVNSAPFVIVGGTAGVNILSNGAAELQNALSAVPPTSFIKIDVTQSGSKILVKVKTDRALNNATMHFALVSRHVIWPTVPGTNGEKEFYDVMNKMYPSGKGTPFSQAAMEERTYEFSPSIGVTDTWTKGAQYVAVWIQSDPGQPNQGEVLQAGLSKTSTVPVDYSYPKATALSLSIPGSKYLRVDRSAEINKSITLTNPTSAPIVVNLSIKGADLLSQAGITATVAPTSLTIPANGSGSAVINVKAGTRSVMVGVEAALAGDDGLGKAVSPVYYLVNGGKIVNYYGFADQGPTTTQIAAGELPNYFQDVVYMPYAAEFNNSYPMSDFSAAVFSFDAYWLNIRGELLTSIEDMLKAKKGVWVQSQAGMTAVYVQYPTNVQFDATRAWYKNVVGIEFVKGEPRAQQNGNQINLLPIPVKGVAKDPIGDGVAFTGNQYGQAWPFYNQAVTDIMKLTSGSLAKSVLYMDNLAANIGMVRVSPTYGGRLVYSSIGTEVMSDAVQRKKLVGNVFDWLLNTTAGKPSISVSQSILNFGSVEVDLMKDMSVEITNTGTAELSISALNFTGADAASFYVSAGGPVGINPIKIAVGAKHTIKVTFAPSAVKNIFGAVLNFTSNADTPPTVQLRGSSSVTSVETDVVSETGAIGMKLVGSNPITDNTSVRVSGNGNIAITVVDAAGRTVSTLFDGSINGTQSVSIASSALASGTYSIVASNGSDRAVLTVMVVR